ncbi:MAG TPA: helix-turn-helix transcriptional regulator, partial [Caulobacteraceae bacterium]|nr:helix-turn-helix transcriptional regulator [Caulobacteraceae bacterium]
FTANDKVLNWTASDSLGAGMRRFADGSYFDRSARVRLALASRHVGFLREHDVYTDEMLEGDPLYREVLWPAGLGWCAAMTIPLPTNDVLFISLERERSRGPVEDRAIEQLDLLRPHLARAAMMAARLQLERARAAADALAMIGLPALVFDNQGKVLAANDLIEAQSGAVAWRAHDRVYLKDVHADALFRQAIATLHADGAAPRSFAVRGPSDGAAALVAHVVPLRRSGRDLIARCAGVLLLSPVTLPKAPPVELVRSLFDLTPAEARVARHLTTGQTVEEIAIESGVSPHTVRTQVRGVLEKTGCRRQVEAVALLGGIAAPGV